ncbi:hypothetical protein J6590_104354, partial [Homalodisca vitripennis]
MQQTGVYGGALAMTIHRRGWPTTVISNVPRVAVRYATNGCIWSGALAMTITELFGGEPTMRDQQCTTCKLQSMQQGMEWSSSHDDSQSAIWR